MVAEHLVAQADESRKLLRLITAREARARRGISRAKEYSLLALDPTWPKPVRRGTMRYYVEGEIEEHIAGLIAERDAANGALPDSQLAMIGQPGYCRSCGLPLSPTGKRGRPKVRCDNCRNIARSDSGLSRG